MTQAEHADRIKTVLQSVNCYVADSRRDIDLGYEYGLRGHAFQVGSVSGGFDLANMARLRTPGPTSARRTIMLKARHVWVYRGLVAMEALRRNADLLDGYRLVLYYVDDQNVWRDAAARLSRESGIEVEVLPQVPYDEILRQHGQARVSISLTISDGVNISFLEAMAMGSFPIQSAGSATTEWAEQGETALFAGAEDVDAVAAAIRRALMDDALVDRAANVNLGVIQERVDIERMRDPVTALYERIAAHPRARPVAASGRPGGLRLSSSHRRPSNRPPSPSVRADEPVVRSVPAISVPAPAASGRGVRLTDPRLPLVTIITPTYNRASLLPDTIESILTQDYPNLEYIVLDDGSTDDTQALLRRCGDAIRWEHHPNMGQPRTVNRGLELAQGEIIGLVSSDDPLLPGAISALVDVLQQQPDVLVVYPDWDVIDGGGRYVYHVDTFDYSYVDMVRYHHTYPGPGALFRRSVVERIGGYDPSFRFAPDYDFWLRAGLLGPFRRVPQTLAAYRAHGSAITQAERGVAMARELVRVIDKLYERADLPPDVLAVQMEAYRNAHFHAGIALQVDPPPDERFSFRDFLFERRPEPRSVPVPGEASSPAPVLAIPQPSAIRPAWPAHPARLAHSVLNTAAAPVAGVRRAVVQTYDDLSGSQLGRIKHAVPLQWRVATRRFLSTSGRGMSR
jgi:GT2 family glycosyltransferase